MKRSDKSELNARRPTLIATAQRTGYAVDKGGVNRSSATIDDMPPVVPSPDQLPFFEELATSPRPRRPHLRIQPPLLADLTARQRKAVTHANGPLLIVAGAGTGKTTVITRRIAWLIAEKRALPSEILALTFTDRAALEMVERVDRLVPYGQTDAASAPSTRSGIDCCGSTRWRRGCRIGPRSCRGRSRSSSSASIYLSCRWTDIGRLEIRRAFYRRS